MKDVSLSCMGFNIYAGNLHDISQKQYQQVINTINAYSFVLTKKDDLFRKALIESDILLPDGFPIVSALKILEKVKIKKIAGADIFSHLMNMAEKTGLRVYFLGSSINTLEKIVAKANEEFPHVKIGFFSPPYKHEFSLEDNSQILSHINEFRPDIVFVGMTAPKQEKWVYEHRNSIHADIICSIGAVFDFYAGTVNRPSPMWVYLNLEWFIRLLKEPKRLWKRYLIHSPKFMIDVFMEKLSRKDK